MYFYENPLVIGLLGASVFIAVYFSIVVFKEIIKGKRKEEKK